MNQLGTAGLAVTPALVEDADWAARSQASLGHVRVGRIVVAPPWDVPHLADEEILVVIKPSMGFGTGHHESTRLCLALLQEVDVRDRLVIDAGTGSGVLAIAAAKLGAKNVVAFDVDPDAVESARENVALDASGVSSRIRVAAGDLRESRAPADILLANLTGATLVASAGSLTALVSGGGWLVVSGFQAHESEAVLHAFGGVARCVRVEAEEGWRAALLQLAPREQQHRQRDERDALGAQGPVAQRDEPHAGS
jgi:ribosomal protein L11 methyltransferase